MFIQHLWTQPHFIPPVILTAASWEENRLHCCTDEELECWKSELLTKRSDSVSNTAITGWWQGVGCDGSAEAALTACACSKVGGSTLLHTSPWVQPPE